MFRRPSKKQLLIRRIIAYTVMVLAVITIVAGTVLFVLGYRLDGHNGLEQGALLQFDSQPNGASVTVDGRVLNGRTATKLSVLAGSHTITYNRDGYETWSKSLDIVAGTLTWLDYVRLVPKDRTVEKVASYSSLADAEIAPDGETIIVHEQPSNTTFQLVDIRGDTIRSSTITLPAAVYQTTNTSATHSFTIEEWDVGGRYVLLRHQSAETSEWIVMDTQNPTESINVTRLLGVAVSDLQFAGTSGNVLYGLTDGVMRRFDIASGTISRALVTNVQHFSIYATDTITYVGTDGSDSNRLVAGMYREGQDVPFVLHSAPAGTASLLIATARYANEDYIAVAEGSTVVVSKGRYPTSLDEIDSSFSPLHTLTLPGAVQALSFSPGDRYVLAQSGTNTVSYELEHARTTTAAIQTTQTNPVPLRWLDGAHVWADYDNQLTMRDFDGTNVYTINSVEAGFSAKINNNGRYFYSIGKDDAGYHLQRVRLLP